LASKKILSRHATGNINIVTATGDDSERARRRIVRFACVNGRDSIGNALIIFNHWNITKCWTSWPYGRCCCVPVYGYVVMTALDEKGPKPSGTETFFHGVSNAFSFYLFIRDDPGTGSAKTFRNSLLERFRRRRSTVKYEIT
jgi:hypothetical protein